MFNKELYKEYAGILEGMGVHVPEHIEDVYKSYICDQLKDLPYTDLAITKMYTVVFFLKYIKKIDGNIKFKDLYSKVEAQKKIISRAMSSIDINFEDSKEVITAQEDWSSLYSIKMGVGAGIQEIAVKAKKVPKPKAKAKAKIQGTS
ncbi:hypothetical protein NECID01_1586 [Nematocida sp. AWRm77]|nr:hypothetical protein NECID01_1586 [Nematocida sp. AWRm77]